MVLLVLGATDFELAELRRCLSDGGPGRPRRVLYLRTGWGRRAAEQAVQRVLRASPPTVALNVGFAGALQPGRRIGEVFLVRRTCRARLVPGHRPAAPDQLLDPLLLRWAGGLLGRRGVALADLATAERPVCAPADKLRLGCSTGAALVDMEGYWLARVLGRAGVPLLMLKVVSDTAEQQLPDGLAQSVGLSPRLLLHLLGRPREVAELLRLARSAREARRALTPLAAELARQWLSRPLAAAVAWS